MAKRKARSLTTVIAILVIGFLAAFFLYMWRYDYKIQVVQEYAPIIRTLRGLLRVNLNGEYGFSGPVGVFTISNASASRVRLMDTRQVYPLFDVKLQMKDDAGQWQDVPLQSEYARRRANLPKTDLYDKDNDALVELIPGTAGHARVIPLSALFVIPSAKTHSYKLTAAYQPEKMAEAMGDLFNFLDVTREGVTVSESFDWPEAKPKPEKEAEPAPAKPAEPAVPAPAEK